MPLTHNSFGLSRWNLRCTRSSAVATLSGHLTLVGPKVWQRRHVSSARRWYSPTTFAYGSIWSWRTQCCGAALLPDSVAAVVLGF